MQDLQTETYPMRRNVPTMVRQASCGSSTSANVAASRNCTKHQVKCDYMENVGSDSEGQQSPEQAAVMLTPNSENRVDLWQQSGNYPFPDLQVFPPPHAHEYSKNDLRLIHHLSTISNDLLLKGSTSLTMWSQKMPK
jgi:hypothetical protein